MRFKKYNYLTPEFYFTSSAFYRSLLPVEKWSSTLLDFEFWMKTMAVISVNKLKILKLNFEQIFTLILKISVLTFEKMQFAMPASLDGLGVFSSSKSKTRLIVALWVWTTYLRSSGSFWGGHLTPLLNSKSASICHAILRGWSWGILF